MSELVNKAVDYIGKTKYVILATTTNEGIPQQRTLASFANDGLTLYFSTGKGSGKVGQIASNPNVSVLLQHEGQDIPSFRNVTVIGKATKLEGNEEQKAIQLLSSRNPRFKERAEKGQLSDTAIFGIEPAIFKYLDFSNGLGPDAVKEVVL